MRLVDVELHPVELAQQVIGELDVGLVDLVDQHDRGGRRRERLPEHAALDVMRDVADVRVAQLRIAQPRHGVVFVEALLRELDRMEFFVYETHQTIRARHRPLVVITSNNEKELPDAFLRRCFFHYIRFPDRETMERIVDVHYPGLKRALLAEALEVFFNLREVPGLKKKPSTSELLDWLKLLLHEDMPLEVLQSKDPAKAIPPLHGALLKNEADVQLFEKLAFLSRRGS